MLPQPGNAFAQQKEIDRQANQRMQRHPRDISHDRSSSVSTVRFKPLNIPPKESLSASNQDMPGTPRTTMSMFDDDSLAEENQRSQPDPMPRHRKKAKKGKKKTGAKWSSYAVEHPLSAGSSAMPAPLLSEKPGGLELIKSTFTKGRRALTKATPVSTSQPEHAFAPPYATYRNYGLHPSGHRDVPTAFSELESADPAVLCARVTAPSRGGPDASHASAGRLQRPWLFDQHSSAMMSNQSAYAPVHHRAGTSQGPTFLNKHFTGSQSQIPNIAASRDLVMSPQPAIPLSMQIPQSANPGPYQTSTCRSGHGSNLPAYRPHAGMMPYSHYVADRSRQDARLSTGTQQTYATSQSNYASITGNRGIILGHTSISPTRRGTYAVAGNVEVMSCPSVSSMTGIMDQVSPTSQGPESQSPNHFGPRRQFDSYQPRLDAALPTLPPSASQDQPTGNTQSLPYQGPSVGNTEVDSQHKPDSVLTGTWEPPLCSDPPYIATFDGLVPATSLYNFNASKDTKSEGQKSEVEAAETADDWDEDEESYHAPNDVSRLLHKSRFRGAFSNGDLDMSYRKWSLDEESPVFTSSATSLGRTQVAASPTRHHSGGDDGGVAEEEVTTGIRHSLPCAQRILSPEVPTYIQNVAAAAGPLLPEAVNINRPEYKAPQYSALVGPQVTSAHLQPISPRRAANKVTAGFGGPAPTRTDSIHQSSPTASHQDQSSLAILQHRLERDHYALRQHISTAMKETQDKMLACLEEQISGMKSTVLERVGALEGEVALLRQQMAELKNAVPAARLVPRVGQEGKGMGKREGVEEEESQRRQAGGWTGDIGRRWYSKEAGRQ